MSFSRNLARPLVAMLFLAVAAPVMAGPAFVQSVSEAAQTDTVIAAFYAERDFAPLWTGPQDGARLQALMAALDQASAHGLPVARYDAAGLRKLAESARVEGDLGRLEVALTAAYLSYARDISSGALEPVKVDAGIIRDITRPDPAALLNAIAISADPAHYLHDLIPTNPAYTILMAEKATLEAKIVAGGWGPEVQAASLQPKDIGPAVVQLRDRLITLGYLVPSATASYDATIQRAVQRFQAEQGLLSDGIARESTITAINAAPQTRLQSVIVALERLRWMGKVDLGARYIWVNQPDFTVKIFDHGQETFRSRVVIGKNSSETRSPEFSDQMEYMAVNPSWGVPRSIIVNEYLPLLQKDPNAVGHLQVIDGNGNVMSRAAIDFASYSGKTFPFGLRQAPSDGNALGKVKFMFPNPNNIYLHDTPAKNLFANEVRAYSHGCIRVGSPMDLAYALLAAQTDDPKGVFQKALDSGAETKVALTVPLPVHLVYFTAFPNANGVVTYRNDVYGRDGRLYEALQKAGLESGAITG